MAKLELFSAAWCGPCQVIKPIIQKLKDESDESVLDVHIVDVDTEPDRVQELNITSVPTLVYTSDDGEEKRHRGVITKKDLLNFINY